MIGERKKTRGRFWMCYVDGADMPKHKHWTLDKAIAEAERLAELTRQDVFVLEASNFTRYTPPVPLPMIEWKETKI